MCLLEVHLLQNWIETLQLVLKGQILTEWHLVHGMIILLLVEILRVLKLYIDILSIVKHNIILSLTIWVLVIFLITFLRPQFIHLRLRTGILLWNKLLIIIVVRLELLLLEEWECHVLVIQHLLLLKSWASLHILIDLRIKLGLLIQLK